MKNSELFNEVRMAYKGQPLSGKEVKELLSELPYGKTDLFLMALVSTGCIERPRKGQYLFTVHPIHHDLLNKAYSYVRKKNKQYNKPKSVEEPVDEIQKAINLLMATGEYEIYHVEKIIKRTKL